MYKYIAVHLKEGRSRRAFKALKPELFLQFLPVLLRNAINIIYPLWTSQILQEILLKRASYADSRCISKENCTKKG